MRKNDSVPNISYDRQKAFNRVFFKKKKKTVIHSIFQNNCFYIRCLICTLETSDDTKDLKTLGMTNHSKVQRACHSWWNKYRPSQKKIKSKEYAKAHSVNNKKIYYFLVCLLQWIQKYNSMLILLSYDMIMSVILNRRANRLFDCWNVSPTNVLIWYLWWYNVCWTWLLF